MKEHLVRTMELEIVRSHVKSFADTSAGVVEKQEERVIACATAQSTIHMLKHQLHLFGLEVAEDGLTRPLERQG